MRFDADTTGQEVLVFSPDEEDALTTNPPTRESMEASGDIGFEIGYRYPDTNLTVVFNALHKLKLPINTSLRFIDSIGRGIGAHRDDLISLQDRIETANPRELGLLEIAAFEEIHKGEINRELDRRIRNTKGRLQSLFGVAARSARKS